MLRRHRPGALLTPGAVLVDGHGFASLVEEVRKLLGEWDIPVARQVSTSVSAVLLDLTELATPASCSSDAHRWRAASRDKRRHVRR